MSFYNKLITSIFIVGVLAIFSIAGAAQVTTATPQTGKAEPVQKADKEMGKTRFGHRKGMMMRRGDMMGSFRGLGLTDLQKTEIQSILSSNRANRTPEAKAEMRTLMMARRTGTLTAAQDDRLKTIRLDAKEKAKAVHAQILNVLTDDQKATIEQRKKDMTDRMQRRKTRIDQATPPTKIN